MKVYTLCRSLLIICVMKFLRFKCCGEFSWRRVVVYTSVSFLEWIFQIDRTEFYVMLMIKMIKFKNKCVWYRKNWDIIHSIIWIGNFLPGLQSNKMFLFQMKEEKCIIFLEIEVDQRSQKIIDEKTKATQFHSGQFFPSISLNFIISIIAQIKWLITLKSI